MGGGVLSVLLVRGAVAVLGRCGVDGTSCSTSSRPKKGLSQLSQLFFKGVLEGLCLDLCLVGALVVLSGCSGVAGSSVLARAP